MDHEPRCFIDPQRHFFTTKSFVALDSSLETYKDVLPKRSKSAEPALYSALQAEDDIFGGHHVCDAETCSDPLHGQSSSKKKQKWYRMIPLPLLIYIILSLSLTMTIVYYHTPLLAMLRSLSIWIQAQGWKGYVLCSGFLFLTSFPFTLGYSLCILLIGITYGFPMGIFPAYIGSLLGAMASFLISRRFFREAVARHIDQSTSISIAKDILLQHQIKFLFIFRMAPIPFNLINFICSGLDVAFSNYAIVTAIVLCKVVLHVYVGSTIGSLAQDSGDSNGHPSKAKMIEFAVSIFFALTFMIVTTLVYFKYKKKWQAHQKLLSEGVIQFGDDVLV